MPQWIGPSARPKLLVCLIVLRLELHECVAVGIKVSERTSVAMERSSACGMRTKIYTFVLIHFQFLFLDTYQSETIAVTIQKFECKHLKNEQEIETMVVVIHR